MTTAAPPVESTPRLRVEGGIERSDCPLADPAYKDIRVTLTTARFEGLKGMTEAEVAEIYAPYVGKEQPIAVICEIRDAVATALRRRGYLAAVQVPVQQIENGVVQFQVLYARLTAIRVRGDAGRNEQLVASYLEPLTKEEVFNQKTAERRLLLVRDLPGIDVRLALKPTGKPGEVFGEVTLVRTPIQADLNVQNFAANETGRYGVQARVLINGLTGLGDQTLIGYYSTVEPREQRVLQLGHEYRLGGNGLTVAARFSYAWTRPELPAAADTLRARTLFATGEARYPFRRTQGASLWGAAGFDFIHQKVRFGPPLINFDRLRVGYVRFDGEYVDTSPAPRWRVVYSGEARKGFNVLKASPKPGSPGLALSRADGDSRATVLRGSMSVDRLLGQDFAITASMRGQYAFDPVLAFEEFSGGNYTVGRGFDPGTILGDTGGGGSLELRYNGFSRSSRFSLQPFTFVDVVGVLNDGFRNDGRLISAGGGVRASFNQRFRLDLTLAVPLESAGFGIRIDDPRILLSFTSKLLPWGAF